MTVRQINEEMGINGGYLNSPEMHKGKYIGNVKIYRARKRKGVLQFLPVVGKWFDAPNNWAIANGNGRIIATDEWKRVELV